MGPNSNLTKTICTCNKMTKDIHTYSGGITLPKVNTINFKKIFSNFAELLRGNPTVFSVLFTIVIIYFILAVWARKKDKKDVEKVSSISLMRLELRFMLCLSHSYAPQSLCC